MNKYLSYYVIIVVNAYDEKGLSIMETVTVNGGPKVVWVRNGRFARVSAYRLGCFLLEAGVCQRASK